MPNNSPLCDYAYWDLPLRHHRALNIPGVWGQSPHLVNLTPERGPIL